MAHEQSIAFTRAGYILTGLSAIFFLMDATMKLLRLPEVLKTTEQLGWSATSVVPLALILLACTLLYLVPRTSFLGAILLSAYLGGAVATHARIGAPFLSHTLFGVYVAIVMWGGLYLRDARLRCLV
ncbi:MAG: DoxX family protein [Steroidobacteraceae bacterium]